MTCRQQQRVLAALRAFERRMAADLRALSAKVEAMTAELEAMTPPPEDRPIPYTVTEASQ